MKKLLSISILITLLWTGVACATAHFLSSEYVTLYSFQQRTDDGAIFNGTVEKKIIFKCNNQATLEIFTGWKSVYRKFATIEVCQKVAKKLIRLFSDSNELPVSRIEISVRDRKVAEDIKVYY